MKITGINGTFTLTFSKGGATEFARTFFRLTEGTSPFASLLALSLLPLSTLPFLSSLLFLSVLLSSLLFLSFLPPPPPPPKKKKETPTVYQWLIISFLCKYWFFFPTGHLITDEPTNSGTSNRQDHIIIY